MIKNEIARGTVSLYNGKVQRYKVDEGKKVYRERRPNCRKQYRCLLTIRFLQYVAAHFRGDDKWSLDACYGAALQSGTFRRNEMVCTKTLYNYVDLGLLSIKNIDLPEKLRRNTKRKKTNENRRVLGKSIEERPEFVALRTEFGHWEPEVSELKIYFTHPYTSCEKGANECHNRMLCQCIPKGKSIANFTADDICFFADSINGLPRKLLGYATPKALFDKQLALIYAA